MRQEIKNFCQTYKIKNVDTITQQYEVGELILFLPPQPTGREKKALQDLIGRVGEVDYLDYVRSNNTFELIMKWRENTRSP